MRKPFPGSVRLHAPLLLLTLFWSASASAEVSLAKSEGWEFFSDGRINGFISYMNGEGYPISPNSVLPGAGFESFQTDQNNKISAVRLRSGFVGSVLGFAFVRRLTDQTTVRARVAMWSIIENPRIKASTNYPDIREVYAKLEGPWGGFLVGRTLALFSRGAILLNSNLQHGNGLGYPCNADGIGPTCGHVGFGVIFAGFNPQMTYNTPTLGGFQLTVGLFDPVSLPGKYEATPLPRPEAELTFDQNLGASVKLHLFVNGLWQRLDQQGKPAEPGFEPKSASSRGVGYGGWAEVAKVKLGFAGHYGYGLGIWNTLENTPQVVDRELTLRKFDGYYGTLAASLGRFDLNAGFGISRVFITPADVQDVVTARTSTVRWQRGMSVGGYLRATEHVVLALEYFRADISWQLGEKQNVNFANTGLTFLW